MRKAKKYIIRICIKERITRSFLALDRERCSKVRSVWLNCHALPKCIRYPCIFRDVTSSKTLTQLWLSWRLISRDRSVFCLNIPRAFPRSLLTLQ